ncbi:response regulator [bacterium]|nr:MAG: response regulator [bacterium]
MAGNSLEGSRVLLVEDNADDEALTVRALRKLDPTCIVDVARDGQQAVDYLAADGVPRPDLILLDLKLPKLNGIEVLRFARSTETMKTVPTVMLTSSDEPSDLMGSYEAGASGFVRKPVGYEEYVDVVRALGRFWLQVNLRPPK